MKPILVAKNKNRHNSKKVKNAQGRSLKDKTAVVGMVQRQGKVNAHHVPDTKTKTLMEQIVKHVKGTAQLYTDEWLAYNKVARMYQYDYVNGASEYVVDDVYTNTIEGFWAGLKRGVQVLTIHGLRSIFKIMWMSLFFDITLVIVLTVNASIFCSLTLVFIQNTRS